MAGSGERPGRNDDETPTHPTLLVPDPLRGARPSVVDGVPARRRPCLLVLSGPRMGDLVPVDIAGGLLIGRDPTAGLSLLDEGVSRRHVRVIVEGEVVRLTDLSSTNGTWIEGRRIADVELVDGVRFRVGQTTVIKFAWQDPLEVEYQRQLVDTALRDNLTRAFNRRYFLERLDSEVAFAARHKAPLALLLVDVDRFAWINRVHGHSGGDSVLRYVAGALFGTIRTDDVLARQGDDTFAIILRDSSLEGAMRLGERLRAVVLEQSCEVEGRLVEVRVSVGVGAVRPVEGVQALALLASAKAGLRRAKQEGRNRVGVDEKRFRLDPQAR